MPANMAHIDIALFSGVYTARALNPVTSETHARENLAASLGHLLLTVSQIPLELVSAFIPM